MSKEALCIRAFAETIRNRMKKKSLIKNLRTDSGGEEPKNGSAVFVFYSLLLESLLYIPYKNEEPDLPDVSSYTATQLKQGNEEVHSKLVEIAERKKTRDDVSFFFATNLIPNINEPYRDVVLDAVDTLVQNDIGIGKATKKKLKNARNKNTPADYLAEVFILAVCSGKNRSESGNADKSTSPIEEAPSITQELIVVTDSRPLHPTDFFRGRDMLLDEIKNRLTGTAKLLLLNGMGGIGKTEICRKLFHEAINLKIPEVSKTGWLTYSGSIEQTVYARFPEIQNPSEKAADYLLQAEQYINSLGSTLLLFVDNTNDMTEKETAWLLKLGCKVLLTSRRRNAERLQALEIGKLKTEDCRILYRQHLSLQAFNGDSDSIYGIDYTEDSSPDENLDAIIELADRHTLAIELLAKTQKAAMQSVKA